MVGRRAGIERSGHWGLLGQSSVSTVSRTLSTRLPQSKSLRGRGAAEGGLAGGCARRHDEGDKHGMSVDRASVHARGLVSYTEPTAEYAPPPFRSPSGAKVPELWPPTGACPCPPASSLLTYYLGGDRAA